MTDELQIIRHGDVALIRVDEIPDGLQLAMTNVVAEGEVTGHAHTIEGADVSMLVMDANLAQNLFAKATGIPTGQVLVVTGDEATITHQEHKTVRIPQGNWVVAQQRQAGFERKSEPVWD
jgi:hypothetical protein